MPVNVSNISVQKIKTTAIKSYPFLVKNIRKELDEMESFFRQRTAQSFRKVGWFIHHHLLQNKEKADYGQNFYERLAADVGRDKTSLFRMVQFYRAYPNLATWQDLNWSHYKCLITIKDELARGKLEAKVIRHNWNVRQLQKYLSAQHAPKIEQDMRKSVPQMKVTRGQLDIFKVLATDVRRKGDTELLIDYGFGVYRPFPDGKKKRFKDGDLLKRAGRHYAKTDIADKARYTYKAYIERVVDGDTLVVLIEGGGGNLVKERLRLRGINSPERKNKEGQMAKRFVEKQLKGLPFIIIRTYKEKIDMYARYITDVFYLQGETDAGKVAAQGHFLNQDLLDERLAFVYP